MSIIRRAIKSIFWQLGYEVRSLARHGDLAPDEIAVTGLKDARFYTQWAAPFRLFTPWAGHPEFTKYYEGVQRHTLLLPASCYMLVCFARYASRLDGNVAECGVYKGGTALLLARVLQTVKKRLFLFDSFQGLPKVDPVHDNYYRAGDFSFPSVGAIQRLLEDHASFVTIKEGWIPNTFVGLEQERYALVHVDVDLYQTTLDCCAYFYPRLVSGAVMVFDDYGYPACRGEKDAVDEFFQDKPDKPFVLPTGQGVLLKG